MGAVFRCARRRFRRLGPPASVPSEPESLRRQAIPAAFLLLDTFHHRLSLMRTRTHVYAGGSRVSAALDAWFVEEVLPLERRLIRYLLHARQPVSEIEDLRQEVFARVYEAARVQRPEPVWPYVYMVARNLMVDRLRREQVVPIDLLAD